MVIHCQINEIVHNQPGEDTYVCKIRAKKKVIYQLSGSIPLSRLLFETHLLLVDDAIKALNLNYNTKYFLKASNPTANV